MTWTTASATTEMQNKMWSINQGGKLSSLMTAKELLTVSQDSTSLHLGSLASWLYSSSIRVPHLTEIIKLRKKTQNAKITFCFLSDPYTGNITNKVPFCTKAERPPYNTSKSHTYQFEVLVIYSLTSQLKAYRRKQRLRKSSHKTLPRSFPRWTQGFIVSQLRMFTSKVQEEEFSRADLERLHCILLSTEL